MYVRICVYVYVYMYVDRGICRVLDKGEGRTVDEDNRK